MRKSSHLQKLTFATFILTISASIFLISSYYTNSESVLANNSNQKPSQKYSPPKRPHPRQRNNPRNRNQKPTWQSIISKIFGRKTQQPIGRGGYCFLASPENYTIYNTRPVFVWTGNLQKIAVANSGSDISFWDTNIENQHKFVSYTGQENLQPGKSYELQGFNNNRIAMLVEFQIMNSQQRQVITDELNALEQKLKTEGADKQTIAMARTDYFIGKEMFSDALQEIYSVENPSAELSNLLINLPEKLCAKQ